MVKVGASPALQGGHVTQVWPIRAQHLPGYSEWLGTVHLTQMGPIKVLPWPYPRAGAFPLGCTRGLRVRLGTWRGRVG